MVIVWSLAGFKRRKLETQPFARERDPLLYNPCAWFVREEKTDESSGDSVPDPRWFQESGADDSSGISEHDNARGDEIRQAKDSAAEEAVTFWRAEGVGK